MENIAGIDDFCGFTRLDTARNLPSQLLTWNDDDRTEILATFLKLAGSLIE